MQANGGCIDLAQTLVVSQRNAGTGQIFGRSAGLC